MGSRPYLPIKRRRPTALGYYNPHVPDPPAAPPPVTPPDSDRYMGLNIGWPYDWDGNRVYADAVKSARVFFDDGDTGGSDPAALDANGWPTEDFRFVLWHGIARMNGTYAMSFTGQASVAIGFGPASLSAVTYNAGTNTSTATITYPDTSPSSGVELVFTATKRLAIDSPGTGITNLAIMRPLTQGSASSYSVDTLFTSQFGDIVSMFRGARFMDLTLTNGKLDWESSWSERALPGAASTNAGHGMPWEHCVLLANTFNVDAWICVPVAADDDYVTKLAQLFRYGSDGVNPYTSVQASPVYPPLNSDRVLWIEYANELWNSAAAFTQFGWNFDAATAEVGAGGSPLNYDGESNDVFWAWRRNGKRTVEISLQFRAVFGDAAMMTRIRPVLEWQLNNGQETATAALGFIDGYYNNTNGTNVVTPHPVSYFIYGGSGSAYYGPDNGAADLDIETLWDTDTFDLAIWAPQQLKDASWAAAFGLRRLAYEGGPGMDAGPSNPVKLLAWNDARIKDEVIDHQAFWEEYGGDALFYFTLGGSDEGPYFQWNMVSNIFDAVNTSPKMQGIATAAVVAKSAVTIGALPPATVEGNVFSVASRGWAVPGGSGSITLTAGTDLRWTSYNFRTTAAGSFIAKATYVGSTGTFAVYLHDTQVGSGGAGSGTLTCTPLALDVGLHGLRVVCLTGDMDVVSVQLEAA